MVNWAEYQTAYCQWIRRDHFEKFVEYSYESAKPERQFYSLSLKAKHAALIDAINRFLRDCGRVVIRHSDAMYVIKTKGTDGRFSKDYDAEYEAEVQVILDATELVRDAWSDYVREAYLHFQETPTPQQPTPGELTMTTATVLFLAANPSGSVRLALDEEHRDIKQKIRASDHRDSLVLKVNFATRPDDLQQTLLEEKPVIVHFSGHGAGKDGLVFHGDTAEEEKLVTADALQHLFATLRDNIRIVLLNACYSEKQAKAIVEVVDFVVGMKRSVSDKAARLFAASFYRGLGFGRSVQDAFALGVSALKLEGLGGDENQPILLVRPGADARASIVEGIATNP